MLAKRSSVSFAMIPRNAVVSIWSTYRWKRLLGSDVEPVDLIRTNHSPGQYWWITKRSKKKGVHRWQALDYLARPAG